MGKWIKGCILPFPNKSDLGFIKNYRGVTLSTLAAKVYNVLLLNFIQPEVEKMFKKNQNGFWRNQSTILQIQTISRIIEGVHAKSWDNVIVRRFFLGIWFHTKRKDEANIINIWSPPQRNCYSYVMIYKNLKAVVHLPNGDIEFFDIMVRLTKRYINTISVLIYPDYVLWTSIDLIKRKRFYIKKNKK